MPNLVKINLASIITLHDLDCPLVKYLFVYELYVTNLSRIMSSITAQQTKHDLELVPKEKRLEIVKCNRRLNPRNKQIEPIFQFVVDALALTLCYSAFLITVDVPEICPRVHGQNFDALPTDEDIVSFLKELGHTREIKTIADIFKKPASPKLSTVLASHEEPTRKSKRVKRPAKKSFDASTTSVVIRETMKSLSKKKEKITVEKRKGIDLLSEVALTEEAQYDEVRKKILRDFHKTHPSRLGTVTKITPTTAKTKPSVTNGGTGVKLGVLGVTEEESTKSEAESCGRDEDDSNNDHDSRSEGNDQKRDSGDDNTQSDNEKRSDSKHETDENESGSKYDKEENEEEDEIDEEEKNDEFVKTPSNDTDDEDETKSKDKAEGDEDEGMNYTTNQFDDDVDLRVNEPVTTDEGFIQKEGTNAEMTNVQQGNENLKFTLNQVIEDAYVTLFTIPQKIEFPVTSFSHSSDLAFKFLNFLNIPYIDVEIISLMDVHVHHELPSNQTPILLIVPILVITESSPIFTTIIPQSLPTFTPPPQQSTPNPPPTTKATNPLSMLLNFASVFQFNNRVTILEKEVAKLKRNDPLNTQVTALVHEHLDSRLGATRDKFMSYLSASITARITEQVKSQLPQILPKEVSNFAPSMIKSINAESFQHVVLAKESSQPKSTYEAAATFKEFELKNILIEKMDENKDKDKDPSAGSDRRLKKRKTSKDAEPIAGPKTKDSKSGSSKGAKSQSKSSRKSVQLEELKFEVADSDMPQDQEENPGNDDEEPKGKVASKRDWFTKPKRTQEPIDPDWNV
ncbi:hypothetical protein Tco_1499906 [Tanacetum coccineum]